MKVDKTHYKQVINRAKYLEFNAIQYYQENKNQNSAELINKELDYLIKNDIYHKILHSSKKTFFGDQINIKESLENDFKLLEKYTTFFDNY